MLAFLFTVADLKQLLPQRQTICCHSYFAIIALDCLLSHWEKLNCAVFGWANI